MNQKVFSRQNVNLFTALLVFLVITGIAGLFLASLYSYNSGLEQIADKIEATLSGDEISDPEGYGLLVNSIVYGMGALGLWLARGKKERKNRQFLCQVFQAAEYF